MTDWSNQDATGYATATLSRDPRLTVVSEEPFNAESPLATESNGLSPIGTFYVRNHFPVPALDGAAWRLTVDGAVNRHLTLSLDDLRARPQRTLYATLECAGNGRKGMSPAAEGEPWGWGAVSTATWTGVPLADILEQAGLQDGAQEIVFEGADSGHVAAAGRTITYERSLPRPVALDPDTLIVLAMNGDELTPDHGYPARVLVPGWYGMAAVKWLRRITAARETFRGFYQFDRYVMRPPGTALNDAIPLAGMRIRSLISSPTAGERVPAGEVVLAGYAWSGEAPVERVEIEIDGAGWQPGEWIDPVRDLAWRRWTFHWQATAGDHLARVRATDAAGNTQPEEPQWNALGYCNNAILAIAIRVG